MDIWFMSVLKSPMHDIDIEQNINNKSIINHSKKKCHEYFFQGYRWGSEDYFIETGYKDWWSNIC